MAKLSIKLTGGGTGPFGIQGAPVIVVKIDVDEALMPKDFRKATTVLAATATTFVEAIKIMQEEEPEHTVAVVRVPADQVEAVSALNPVPSEDFPHGGLLIVPAEAERIEFAS